MGAACIDGCYVSKPRTNCSEDFEPFPHVSPEIILAGEFFTFMLKTLTYRDTKAILHLLLTMLYQTPNCVLITDSTAFQHSSDHIYTYIIIIRLHHYQW